MKTIIASLFVCMLLGALALCAGFVWLNTAMHAPSALAAEKIIYVPPGSSVRGIASLLQDNGALEQEPAVFTIAARLRGGKLKAGEYAIPAQSSMGEVIALLQSGKTYQRRIVIPEGLMSVEIVALINAAAAMTGVIDTVPPEGSLMPEGYNYSYGDSRDSIIRRMQAAMRETLDAMWAAKTEAMTLQSAQQALVLASVVEKETGVASERPRVAGVFFNRLRLGMPLQTDPTVIYAVTQGKFRLDRPLSRKDLNTESPYNTYMVQGLPPGPIANPGKASLAAVFAPEAHDYLYFVADGTGGHAFAATHADHLRNVAKWRRLEKAQ